MILTQNIYNLDRFSDHRYAQTWPEKHVRPVAIAKDSSLRWSDVNLDASLVCNIMGV